MVAAREEGGGRRAAAAPRRLQVRNVGSARLTRVGTRRTGRDHARARRHLVFGAG